MSGSRFARPPLHWIDQAFSHRREAVKLKYLYTSGSNGGQCPTLYETDSGDIVVQGYRLTDPEALGQLRDVLPGETFVVVPRGLIEKFGTEART
jgi:hypothetical protein